MYNCQLKNNTMRIFLSVIGMYYCGYYATVLPRKSSKRAKTSLFLYRQIYFFYFTSDQTTKNVILYVVYYTTHQVVFSNMSQYVSSAHITILSYFICAIFMFFFELHKPVHNLKQILFIRTGEYCLTQCTIYVNPCIIY